MPDDRVPEEPREAVQLGEPDEERYAEGQREVADCRTCGQAIWIVYHGRGQNHTVEPREAQLTKSHLTRANACEERLAGLSAEHARLSVAYVESESRASACTSCEKLRSAARNVLDLRGGAAGSYQREQFVRALDDLEAVLAGLGGQRLDRRSKR